MESINLSERIDKYFPLPKSNREFRPSVFIETLNLMQHEGSFHLDDVRHINEDEALRAVLSLDKIPQSSSLGNWLRRMSNDNQSFAAWNEVNKATPANEAQEEQTPYYQIIPPTSGSLI